jgi:hypothetical protein
MQNNARGETSMRICTAAILEDACSNAFADQPIGESGRHKR